MKIWMSSGGNASKKYAWHTVGGILGIALLEMILIIAGTFFIMYFELPKKLISLFLCLAVTALAVFLAVKTGKRSMRESTVFFLDDKDKMFIADIRQLTGYKRGLTGYVKDTFEIQRVLQRIEDEKIIPFGADELLGVERIKEYISEYVLICFVRYPNGHTGKRTYYLVKGYNEEESLLSQLERRKNWRQAMESSPSKNPVYIMISLLACAAFTALCVLSHLDVGILPLEVYYPFLAADVISFTCMICFIIKHRRGE